MHCSDQESCVCSQAALPSPDPKGARIRQLNDQLRGDFISGMVTLTLGVRQLDAATLAEVLVAVRDFRDFSSDNDPRGEHDFGAFQVRQHRIFWKIDYYDTRLQAGSPDPSCADVTTRVLTIMLSSEY